MKLYRKFTLVILSFALISCGDFPEYRYDQSHDYCVMSFPFAGGIFDRKYVGYFNLTSTLQYMDSEPQLAIYIGEPSHIELEVGSVQKLEIDGKEYYPEFKKNYLQAELQYWGPAFIFEHDKASEIYRALQQGNDLTIHGRLEVGAQYETTLYNFFFESDNEPFKSCVNRLLSEEDIKILEHRKNNKSSAE